MPHSRDPRLASIGSLIKSGEIKTFSNIFKHIPKSVIAKSMNWGVSRLETVMDNPGKLTMEECYELGKLMKVKGDKVMMLVAGEVMGRK